MNNNLGTVAAGLAAGVLIALCVQAYRHPVVRPIYRWVQVETECDWMGTHGR